LNVELPIPFDGWGKMEVDLLCADARLAIELDGAQHLSGPEAYRRDRRKDCLLQQNGYFVLRFLAEDVGIRLDGFSTPFCEYWRTRGDIDHRPGSTHAGPQFPSDALYEILCLDSERDKK
jgi:hypothetical protein